MKTKTTCSRCGGSGRYSFNLRHGTVCFGCNGAGCQMVDFNAKAKKDAERLVRQEKINATRDLYIATMATVKFEFNAAFNFDTSTAVGLDMLNSAVFKLTGKDLVAHCKEKMA